MKIKTLQIHDLIPYEFNNRRHPPAQIDRLAASIKEFGFDQPVIVTADNIIIAGHGRWEAAKQLGLETVPCVVSTLDEVKARARRVLDNKLQNDSEWHYDNLGLELGWLEDNGLDLEYWGLDELQFDFDDEEPEEDDFEDGDRDRTETIIKLGDEIELGKHRLKCGDSETDWWTDIEPVLMVTDPPYGVEYDPSHRSDNKKKQGKVSNDHRADWGEVYGAVNAQVAYVWHSGVHTSTFCRSLEEQGYKIIAQIIWNKERFAMSRGDYHWKHEPCWYAVREGSTHNWQGARDQSTVWDIKAREDSGHGHSTQKPIECMARPIKNNTSKGDIVADPFLGSGSTLIAAEQLGRVCYGMELEPKYCQIVVDRYRKYCKDKNKVCKVKLNGEAWPETPSVD